MNDRFMHDLSFWLSGRVDVRIGRVIDVGSVEGLLRCVLQWLEGSGAGTNACSLSAMATSLPGDLTPNLLISMDLCLEPSDALNAVSLIKINGRLF